MGKRTSSGGSGNKRAASAAASSRRSGWENDNEVGNNNNNNQQFRNDHDHNESSRDANEGSGGLEVSTVELSLDDPKTWEQVEIYCEHVIDTIPNLREHEMALQEMARQACAIGGIHHHHQQQQQQKQQQQQHHHHQSTKLPKKISFTKSELDRIVLWKHTVGKNRIYNVKYLNANAEEHIHTFSSAAVQLALKIKLDDILEDGKDGGGMNQAGRTAVQDAISELGKLKGVGPATASAILTLVRPDVFCYLYDEVIDSFEPHRDYKMANYLRVNSRCLKLARTLGAGWTTSRVAKTIWLASRFLSINGVDLADGLPKQWNGGGSAEGSVSNTAGTSATATEGEGDDAGYGEESDDDEDDYDDDIDDEDHMETKKPPAKRRRS